MVSGEAASAYTAEPRISERLTVWRRWFGNSSAMKFLPGIVSTTRIDTSDSERARSFARPTIWLPFTPVAGSIS